MTKKEESLFDGVARVGAKYIAQRLANAALPVDFPDAERRRLVSHAEQEIKTAIGLVRQRLKRAAKSPPVDPAEYTAQWTKVLAACRVLNLKPPKKGQGVDSATVRRHWRSAMDAYHPDKNPGHEDEVRAANNAREVLDAYNESVAGPKTEPKSEGQVP